MTSPQSMTMLDRTLWPQMRALSTTQSSWANGSSRGQATTTILVDAGMRTEMRGKIWKAVKATHK